MSNALNKIRAQSFISTKKKSITQDKARYNIKNHDVEI